MRLATTAPAPVLGFNASVSVSRYFNLPAASAAPPTYLIVSALDRNEYTAASSGQTGTLNGNGAAVGFSNLEGDGRSAGIVFTYNASTGQYTNATFGNFSQLSYTTPSSPNDVVNLSVFTTSSASVVQSAGTNPYALMQLDASGYLGSTTLITNPRYTATVPAFATPNSIAAAAASFVGQAWNMNGCWTLASTIAAEAGASLPVQSTNVGIPGAGNGEWFVLYNGPTSASSAWQNLVSKGDIVSFTTAGGSGHITTCVSGAGATAQLIDNITYESASGIDNPANDGSPYDILVSAAHPASQEFAGAVPQNVVIYALDTPTVTILATTAAITATIGTGLALSPLLRATDPEGHAVTTYQLYDTLSGATFAVGSSQATDHSASAADSVSTLANLSLDYAQAGTDTLEVRAFNGTYWGDWQAVTITVAAPKPLPPKLATQTANQNWAQGSHVSLTLPAGTFTDPQKQALTYSVTTAKGAALPSWLTFNPKTLAFSGTVPAGMGSIPIIVTATDTSGLSTSETFTATVPAAAPTVAHQTPSQTWAEGSHLAVGLPAGIFADPQGENLTLRATLSTGAALPSWLTFNAASATFSGTVPSIAQVLTLKLTATDTSNLSVSETIQVTIAAGTRGITEPAMTIAPIGHLWPLPHLLPIHH